MLKEILIKNGIEEGQANKILEAMKESKVYITKNENIDDRYTKLKTQKADLEKQIADRDSQLEKLSKDNKGNEELVKQLDTLKNENATVKTEYETRIAKMEFDYALNGVLSASKCKNTKALKALLDLEKVSLKEGKFDGLDEQLEGLKTSDSYLFEGTIPANTGSVGSFGQSGQADTGTSSFMSAITNNSLRK